MILDTRFRVLSDAATLKPLRDGAAGIPCSRIPRPQRRGHIEASISLTTSERVTRDSASSATRPH